MTIVYDVVAISRSDAKELGLKYYFGKPCGRGHTCPKYTANRACIDCMKERTAEWRKANPEKIKELWRGIAQRMRDKDPQRVKDTLKRCYDRNPEPFKARSEKWRLDNPVKRQAQHRRRKSAERGAEGTFAVTDIENITSLQKGRCAICARKRKKLTIDHIVPVSKGGSNWPKNLQMVCMPCNIAKRDQDPIDFMQGRGALL